MKRSIILVLFTAYLLNYSYAQDPPAPPQPPEAEIFSDYSHTLGRVCIYFELLGFDKIRSNVSIMTV